MSPSQEIKPIKVKIKRIKKLTERRSSDWQQSRQRPRVTEIIFHLKVGCVGVVIHSN